MERRDRIVSRSSIFTARMSVRGVRRRARCTRKYHAPKCELFRQQLRTGWISDRRRLRDSTALGGWTRYWNLHLPISTPVGEPCDIEMNFATRLLIIGACGLLCAAGFAADSSRKPTLKELERIIRRDPTAKSQHGRIEFGSVRIEQRTALAEVMFVSDQGCVLPFLYKLNPQRNTWKIVNVQRLWYVPRSHLLRGIRA